MRNKQFLLLAILLTTALVMSACGNSEHEEPEENSNEPEEIGCDYWRSRVDFIIDYPPSENVLARDVVVSSTGIAFTLENQAGVRIGYGEDFRIAIYNEGNWWNIMPNNGFIAMTSFIQYGGILQYRRGWDREFGKLPHGRYMFILEFFPGMPGRYGYVMIEFTIDQNAIVNAHHTQLPTAILHPQIELAECNATPIGLTVVFENTSEWEFFLTFNPFNHGYLYNKTHPSIPPPWAELFILDNIGNRHSILTSSEQPWDNAEKWLLENYVLTENMPIGGRIELHLDWEAEVGSLRAGRYLISMVLLGEQVPPPHPHGFFIQLIEIPFTIYDDD